MAATKLGIEQPLEFGKQIVCGSDVFVGHVELIRHVVELTHGIDVEYVGAITQLVDKDAHALALHVVAIAHDDVAQGDENSERAIVRRRRIPPESSSTREPALSARRAKASNSSAP